MPLPKPNAGEEKQEFIDRCMGDDVMLEEHPDEKERAGVCYSLWADKKQLSLHPERRFLPQEQAQVRVKQAKGARTLVGLATTYYDGTKDTEFKLWDGCRERIMPGAFKRAIAEKDDCRSLFNHNPDNVLGRVTADTLTLGETEKGPEYEVNLPDTQCGRDVAVSVERRDVTGSSFQFDVLDETWHKEDGDDIREITNIRLYDVGPVTFPAYPNTAVGVRFVDDLTEARASHAVWQEGEKAKAELRSRVTAAAKKVRDAAGTTPSRSST